MKWPWVSRTAFELVVAQRDHLMAFQHEQTAQIQRLTDHLQRMDRVDRGIGEVPRDPRPVVQPMPPVLIAHIDGYASKAIREQMHKDARRRHVRDRIPWSQIVAEMMPPTEEPREPV